MFYGGRLFIKALALAATKNPVLGKGHNALGETRAGHGSCGTLRKVRSLCRNPCALAGEKVQQSWSNPPLEPCPCVLGGDLPQELAEVTTKIINRAINEALAALSVMLCWDGGRWQRARSKH